MTDVKISVVIPCYNSKSTILRAVNSVLNGSVLPHEILIYDDCSTDGTEKIIKDNFSEHKLVHLIVGSENKGAGHARNELLKNATGNFIAFLDADDWWYPKKIEQQVKKISETRCDIVTTAYDIFDESDLKIGSRYPIKNVNFFTMHFTNWLPTSMTVFRKDLVAAQEMPLIRKRQDYGFWLQIFKNNKILKCCVIDIPMGAYLRRAGSLSSSSIDNIKFNYAMLRDVMAYSRTFSIMIIILNIIIRATRK
jgi:teichuronic acid biosynthesis glycosyltransferase TuaG